MQKMEKIKIGERTYPIRMDLNVLENLQDLFGSLNAFEMDLVGLKVVDGKAIRVETSVRTIKAVLPLMINEGLAIEAANTGNTYEPVNEQIFQECSIPFEELVQITHDEFKRCFAKKQEPGERVTEKTC